MPLFKPRERKHKVLVRRKQSSAPTGTEDANAEQIIPKSQAEKEERKRQLHQELREGLPQASGKKRKRLDKYIDTKLRAEENRDLIKKLAAHQVDTSLLQSSKTLGRVNETKRERLSRTLAEQQAGVGDAQEQEAVLFQRRKHAQAEPEEHESDDVEFGDLHPEEEIDSSTNYTTNGNRSVILSAEEQPTTSFGAGLKRPFELDESGKPLIQKRKRRKVARKLTPESGSDSESVESELDESDSAEEDVEAWNGFSSASEDEPPGSVLDGPANESEESIETPDRSEDESEEEEEDEGEEDSQEEEDDEQRPARASAFRAWAEVQRNEALGFTPSAAPTATPTIQFRPRALSPDLLLHATTSQKPSHRPAAAISVPRSEDVQEARMKLPVVQKEQEIIETIHAHPITVICGDTGSGKSTQVPQMLLENGYGSQRALIGVTQPRRVAAVSVAARVGEELGSFGSTVSHQVRYDTSVSRETAIKFMTDGILLREIQQDFLLSKYSVVVIDEAHERSVNTDILIGMLSRIVALRQELADEKPGGNVKPLKMVIMSATLRVQDFTGNARLFRDGAPPIVQAEGRQYAVTIHFSRRTQRDYIAETVSKVARGHRKLPAGGMLIFLTGQQEISQVARELRSALGVSSNHQNNGTKARESAQDMPLEVEDMDSSVRDQFAEGRQGGFDSDGEDSDTEIRGLDNDDDEEFNLPAQETADAPRDVILKPYILPLYASLPTKEQMRVFQAPPEGCRLIILATNVAETSLTIPGIRYVFDGGRSKERKYDTDTGVQTFEIGWISKASAAQRAGRAGRTGPGHCWRLYSSAMYERDFDEHAIPEILRTPLESTVLSLKSMNIENVVNFPFPTAPDRQQLVVAEKLLMNLGAIDGKGRITQTGRDLTRYPLSPRYGKMLLLAQRNGILPWTIAVVAALAVGDLFMQENQLPQGVQKDSADGTDENTTESEQRHKAYGHAHWMLAQHDDHSDAIKLLTAVASYAEVVGQDTSRRCKDYFLREKAMDEVQQLRSQLQAIVDSQDRHGSSRQNALGLPSQKQRDMLKQIVAAGYLDQIAIRADLLKDESTGFSRKPRRAIEVPYRTLFPSSDVDKTLPYDEQELQRSVFVHPSSVLAHLSIAEMPGYVVYSHLSRAAPKAIDSDKLPRTRMHPLTSIGSKALAALAEGSPLLQIGKPLGKIEELAGGKRQCWVGLSLRGDVDSSGWPIGAWKVLQRREGADWVIETVIAR